MREERFVVFVLSVMAPSFQYLFAFLTRGILAAAPPVAITTPFFACAVTSVPSNMTALTPVILPFSEMSSFASVRHMILFAGLERTVFLVGAK